MFSDPQSSHQGPPLLWIQQGLLFLLQGDLLSCSEVLSVVLTWSPLWGWLLIPSPCGWCGLEGQGRQAGPQDAPPTHTDPNTVLWLYPGAPLRSRRLLTRPVEPFY